MSSNSSISIPMFGYAKRAVFLAWICVLVIMVGVSFDGGSFKLVRAAVHGDKSSHDKDQKSIPIPLPLPLDPLVTCGKPLFLEFTAIYKCPWDRSPKRNPDKYCCQGLHEYFGMNSTKPSRNCLCVPGVWDRLNAEQNQHRIPFVRIFKTCSKMGYIVPFYQKGLGYCNGTKDDKYKPADVNVFYIPKSPSPSLSNWVSRLHKDWLMTVSFVSGIASVPGFLAFLWPFAFDFAHMMKEAVTATRGSKQW